MTKLRKDGYLETDDPVVAACFLGRECFVDTRGPMKGPGVNEDGLLYRRLIAITSTHFGSLAENPWPVLIPAKTVAEVWSDGGYTNPVVAAVLAFATHNYGKTTNIEAWLREHVKEDTHG